MLKVLHLKMAKLFKNFSQDYYWIYNVLNILLIDINVGMCFLTSFWTSSLKSRLCHFQLSTYVNSRLTSDQRESDLVALSEHLERWFGMSLGSVLSRSKMTQDKRRWYSTYLSVSERKRSIGWTNDCKRHTMVIWLMSVSKKKINYEE